MKPVILLNLALARSVANVVSSIYGRRTRWSNVGVFNTEITLSHMITLYLLINLRYCSGYSLQNTHRPVPHFHSYLEHILFFKSFFLS